VTNTNDCTMCQYTWKTNSLHVSRYPYCLSHAWIHVSSGMWHCMTRRVVPDILKEPVTSILKGSRSMSTHTFKTSQTTYPAMQCHISDDHSPWRHHCKNLKICKIKTVWQNLVQIHLEDGSSMFLWNAVSTSRTICCHNTKDQNMMLRTQLYQEV
jgi:hypothetical protein